MKFIGSIYAAAALMLMAVPAHAFTPAGWSAPAKGCVPDEASAGRYSTTGPGVAHLNNNVALIRLVCRIDGTGLEGGSNWLLVVTYRDSTGGSTSANVTARVVRLSRTTGTGGTIATFDSNSSLFIGVVEDAVPFTHTFDFDANYYSVVIQLDRTLTSETVQAFGVAIEVNP